MKLICSVLVLIMLHCDNARAKPFLFGGESVSTCGYDSCHATKPGMINVHIVPHTHDDVGWLKTVDQYYFGSKSDIQKAGVQYILDSVVDALKKDPNRRFIYVETAFFWKWWIKQHDVVKSQVRKLVNNGQLEFIGGAWSMNDEATTNYQSIIDQFTWGLRKLNETFGECGRPKIGWQIDPFGHSRGMAAIFTQLGYDALLLGRIDYQDKNFRFQTRSPEMIWRSSPSNLRNSDLFTSVMYNTYQPPPGFCFDVLCDDEPIIDDKRSPDYNVDQRLNQFLEYIARQTKAYTTEHVIVTMGGDFTYMDANMWYKNLDKLIRYANLQSNETNVNLLYSTPSCYVKAVQENAKKSNISFPVKYDDFFPYASDPTAVWSGYFTSKPAIKRFERIGNNYLQICKQLYALTNLGPEDWADLNVMREAMGVLQHHDAITGTEKDHVAQDYARMLSKGFEECDIVMSTALSKLVSGKKQRQPRLDQTSDVFEPPKPEIDFNTCMLANISQCEFTETQKEFIITIYNPLSHDIDHFVRVPITAKGLEVIGPDGQKVEVQIIPTHSSILKVPGRTSKAQFEAIFKAMNVPAMGFKSFYAKVVPGDMITKEFPVGNFRNGAVQIKVDDKTGKIFELTMNDKTIQFKNDFFYYHAAAGDNRKYNTRSSGAYIFRPNGSLHEVVDVVKNTLYYGPVATELHQVFNDWISQVVRIYNGEDNVEFEWLIGPIPIDDQIGKEVVAKYMTDLKTESSFYTDANGREMIKRIKDFRPTWKLNVTEPVPQNYYPVTSKIVVRDPQEDIEMAVLTDRAQGGTSLENGEIELMVHRRCLHDDAFGVDEALNETQYGQGLVVRGSHYVTLGEYIHHDGLIAYERELAQRKLLQAWTFLSSTMGLSFKDYNSKYSMKFSGLKENLPKNVNILTLEPWKGKSFLLRMEHILEVIDDTHLGQPVKVNLQSLFTPFKILSIRETTLGANQWIEDNHRLKFNTSFQNVDNLLQLSSSYGEQTNEEQEIRWRRGSAMYRKSQRDSNDVKAPRRKYERFEYTMYDADDKFEVVLKAMEIRTFVIETDFV